MPIDPVVIDSVTQSINNSANIIAQDNINRKTRKWNEQQYAKQRADSLADWNMQNEYNSPMSQMARLREAGLNPNLVYGKGADNTAQAVRSSSAPAWNPRAPQSNFDAKSSILLGYDVAMRQAQIDNLKVQNTVLDQESLLKKAQTIATLNQGARTAFDLEFDTELRNVSAEMRRQTLRSLEANTQFTLDQNERAKAMQQPTLTKALEEILSLRQGRKLSDSQIESINKDTRLKQLDIDLREKGIQPNDNIFFRILGRLLERYLNKDGVPFDLNKMPGADNTDSFGRPRN